MAQGWIANESGKAVRVAMAAIADKAKLYVYYKRGHVVLATTPMETFGYQKATVMSVPTDKSPEELVAWVFHQLRDKPCLPVGGEG